MTLVVFLLSIAGVSASEIGDTIASEDTGVIELSHEIESADNNLGTSEEQKVTQTDNEEKTGETDDGTFGALESKISSASSGDTIYLENNYSCEDSWTQDSGIYILTSNLVIDGQGHTIDAKQKTRIFCVDEVDNVTIKNIKFINAKINGHSGGAIFWYDGDYGSVSGCSFVNCSAEYDGGAIEWSHSDGGCVSGCSFVNCSTAGSGGAIDWYDSANGNISDCAFINNTDNYGRTIYMDSGSSASLDRNWFGNTAENYKTSPNAYIDGASTDSWLFLNATVNPESISIAETADIIFKLYLYNGSISDYTSLAKVDLTLNSNGKLDKNVTGLDEKVTFTPTSLGTGSVTATIGDMAYTTTLTVTTDGTTFWDLNQTINGNTNDTITLDRNYAYNPAYDTAFVNGIVINRPVTIKGNGNAIDAKRQARIFYVQSANAVLENLTIINANYNGNGGAIYFTSSATSGTVTNCNFADNKATGDYSYGGAVYFYGAGNVTNCNFTDNKATGTNSLGGAVYFYGAGNVTNCNFTDNSASSRGGAVYFWNQGTVSNCNFADNEAYYGGAIMFVNTGTVTNCNFTGNNATTGSAIYFYSTSATKTVSNSRFLNNRANAEALEITKNDNNITITFTGRNNLLNAIYSRNDAEVTFTNVTYWGANGITTVSATMSGSNKATGQNISVGVVVNGKVVLNEVKVTDDNGTIVLNMNAGENYYIGVRHDTDSYYTEAEKTISNNTKFNVNVTSQTTNNKTVNITAKSNIYSEVMPGKLLFILLDGTEIEATYGGNGTWWAVHKFADYDVYQVNATYEGLDNVTITNGTISISKTPTEITVENETLELLVDDSIATGATLTPADAGDLTFTSSNITVAKVEDGKIIAVGEGSAIITVSFAGNDDYAAAEDKTINVDVIKYDSKVTIEPINNTVYPNNVTIKYSIENKTNVTVTIDGVSDDKISITNDTITVIGLDAGEYTITIINNESRIYHKSNDTKTFTVNKQATSITAADVSTTYNINKDLVITLKDANGNPLTGASVTVDLNGAKTYTTDNNGQVKVSTKGLAPKAYTAKVTFNGNTNYDKSTKNVKVTVKKATPKLTAKKKTFKTSVKTKKYTITLKDNTGKAIKKAKVTLKVKGKTYKATTNSKGKAVFKIKNLKKKGTFKATITYKGNKYYNKVSKKANIKVIVTFKTVSKGSKDKSTVKEIQQALKDHGYYLSYKGHYLKVDGKFKGCTERSVKQFQHDKGLKVTGKVDEKTAKKLGLI